MTSASALQRRAVVPAAGAGRDLAWRVVESAFGRSRLRRCGSCRRRLFSASSCGAGTLHFLLSFAGQDVPFRASAAFGLLAVGAAPLSCCSSCDISSSCWTPLSWVAFDAAARQAGWSSSRSGFVRQRLALDGDHWRGSGRSGEARHSVVSFGRVSAARHSRGRAALCSLGRRRTGRSGGCSRGAARNGDISSSPPGGFNVARIRPSVNDFARGTLLETLSGQISEAQLANRGVERAAPGPRRPWPWTAENPSQHWKRVNIEAAKPSQLSSKGQEWRRKCKIRGERRRLRLGQVERRPRGARS